MRILNPPRCDKNWRQNRRRLYNANMDDEHADERPFRFSLKAMLLAVTLCAAMAGFIRLGIEIYHSTKVPGQQKRAPKVPGAKAPSPKRQQSVLPGRPVVPPDKVSPI
jgi:hypothetical protein